MVQVVDSGGGGVGEMYFLSIFGRSSKARTTEMTSLCVTSRF